MRIDYISMNKGALRDGYRMPIIDDHLLLWRILRVLTSLDLHRHLIYIYIQIRITESDRHKAAFVTHEGQFKFKVVCSRFRGRAVSQNGGR